MIGNVDNLWAQAVTSRRACLWLVLATFGTTVAGAYGDGLTFSILSTILLLAASLMPWRFKIHGDTPLELAIMSGIFKPILIALTVLVALNAMGSDSEAWNAASGVLMVGCAMLPLRRKLTTK